MGYTGDKKREYSRNWMKKRRDEFIKHLGGICQLCGSTDRLEFDHTIASTKTYRPTELWSRRKEVIELELEKCQLLCHDCHISKTIRCLEGGASFRKIGPSGTAWCSSCQCFLNVSSFRSHRRMHDGLYKFCRKCESRKRKVYRGRVKTGELAER